MEFLSKSFRRAALRGEVKGIKVTSVAPCLTHVMYANDLIIFGQAEIGEVESLKRLMEKFGKVSGLRVNPT
jgi:hypothetical protein